MASIAEISALLDQRDQKLYQQLDQRFEALTNIVGERIHASYVSPEFAQAVKRVMRGSNEPGQGPVSNRGQAQGPVANRGRSQARGGNTSTSLVNIPSIKTFDDRTLSELKSQVSTEQFILAIPHFVGNFDIVEEMRTQANNDKAPFKFLKSTDYFSMGEPHTKFIFSTAAELAAFEAKFRKIKEKCFQGVQIVKGSAKFQPKIKLIGVRLACSKEDLKNELLQSNEGLTPNAINIISTYTVKKGQNETINAIVAFNDVELFKAVLQNGKMMCFFNSCRVYEECPVKECSRCLRFDHKVGACKFGQRCKNCGDSHNTKKCRGKQSNCINCVRYNNTFKNANLNTHHRSNNHLCPSRILHLDHEKRRILEQIEPDNHNRNNHRRSRGGNF